MKMVVEPDEKTSNTLTDVFKDWDYQLSRSDLSEIDFDKEDE